MIPKLYEHNEATFTSFGIGALLDTTLCEVTEERNGKYELVLKYPVDGPLYKELQNERIIRVQVNDNKSIQAFRIYRITTPMNGVVTVYAQHISYDLSGVVVFPCSFTNSNPTQIMTYVKNNKLDTSVSFTFTSDIANTKNYEVKSPRTMRNFLGGNKDSLLTTFGGEFEWDNFTVRLKTNRGSDNGISILYGKNLTKLEQNSDISSIYTHLCPYAKVKNGDTEVYVQLTEKVLSITSSLTERKVLIKDFSTSFGSGEGQLEPTEANLRTVAQNYILENILGTLTPNITLSFQELRDQLGYSNLQETIKLCDTITVKYTDLGINAKAKIVKVVYDTLAEKYKSISLGALKPSFEDRVNSLENDVAETEKGLSEVPGAIKGAVDGLEGEIETVRSEIAIAVDEATDKITGADGGCVVLNLDNQERPYEFLIMNNYDINQATKVWRWNINGLGYSPNGYNGPYTTAITNDGKIVADFITTGTMTANIVKAGTIQALTGDSYWNLENGNIKLTGEINATSGSFAHVTIGDTCSIYGNLYLEGSFDTYYYYNSTHYEFETRIGGDAIETEMTKTVDGSSFGSHCYIMPVGMITVPDVYTTMDDVMIFGIARDRSLRDSRLISGLSFSYKQSGSGSSYYSYGEMRLAVAELDVIHYYSEMCHWGINGDNIFEGTWYVSMDKNSAVTNYYDSSASTYYGYLSGRWKIDEVDSFKIAKTNCSIKSIADPFGSSNYYGFLPGTWYTNGTFYFGTSKTSYQIRIDNDQITFNYNSNEIGDIECMSSYVDIQGTWRTNGNSWISSSDIKLKNTIKELDDRYSVLFNNLTPRSYKFNDGTSGRSHTGFIVQEVLEAMDKAGINVDDYGLCCAFGDKNDPETEWGIRYEEIIALCVKEIQTLKKEIQELKEDKK